MFSFIKTFHISSHFWKHYTQWLNFIIIIFTENKEFVTLSTKATLPDINISSISTSSIKTEIYDVLNLQLSILNPNLFL